MGADRLICAHFSGKWRQMRQKYNHTNLLQLSEIIFYEY